MSKSCFLICAQFVFLIGCIEGQPWQSNSPPGKQDVLEDLEPQKIDMTSDDVDVLQACSPKCENNEVCDLDSKTCVTCRIDNDCINNTSGDFCDAGKCVECRADANCTAESNKPICKDNFCESCVSDGDCVDGICDLRPGVGGSCVVGELNTKAQCSECISDSDCRDGLCILTTFDPIVPVVPVYEKYFCLVPANDEPTPCDAPYRTSGIAVTSLGMVTKIVCQPSPKRTTCEAILANFKPTTTCTDDSMCPTGGFCRNKKCTYECLGGSRECENVCSALVNEIGYCP